MSDISKAISSAKSALDIEIAALKKMADGIDSKIEPALKLLTQNQGRVIVTGLGKSGLVGAKIAATLASTGTPSFFVHAADALHGDSGAIHDGDLVIAISNSGETSEVVAVADMAKNWGNKVIAITGKSNSRLATIADATLDISFEKEADPNGLAPTTSTTLTIAIGDAIAAALITYKNFSPQDFGKRHPGGALGKKSNG
jgi:arabinose-5-phosphate isomerase